MNSQNKSAKNTFAKFSKTALLTFLLILQTFFMFTCHYFQLKHEWKGYVNEILMYLCMWILNTETKKKLHLYYSNILRTTLFLFQWFQRHRKQEFFVTSTFVRTETIVLFLSHPLLMYRLERARRLILRCVDNNRCSDDGGAGAYYTITILFN